MSVSIALCLALWSFALATTLFGTRYALRRFRSHPEVMADSALPPVSILKPLKGADHSVEENLESFFHIDYPKFQILFCVADACDPVVPIVRRLMKKHAHVETRLFVGSRDIGPNPKVNNMLVAYEQADHDLILVSDSNVRVVSSYLRRLVPSLTPDVGVVTSVVAGRDENGVGGRLEAMYLNTFYARWMQIAYGFDLAYVIGKSMLFRRSVAERFGGLRTLGQYIAEDYQAGEAMRRLGLTVAVAVDPIAQHIGRSSFSAFWQRHLRWGRIRKSQAPLVFALEIFQGSVGSGLLAAYLGPFLGVSSLVAFAGHVSLWAVCDWLLVDKVGAKLDAKTIGSWFLRELLALPLWLHMACGNSIQWRGARFRVRHGGLLHAYKENKWNSFGELRRAATR